MRFIARYKDELWEVFDPGHVQTINLWRYELTPDGINYIDIDTNADGFMTPVGTRVHTSHINNYFSVVGQRVQMALGERAYQHLYHADEGRAKYWFIKCEIEILHVTPHMPFIEELLDSNHRRVNYRV
jgi:hypothetical protein